MPDKINQFFQWHKAYFFFDGDCSIVRPPCSNPLEPLKEIEDHLNWLYLNR
jgi:hypothetical protein